MLLSLLVADLSAQVGADLASSEAKLATTATQALLSFARTAESYRCGSRAQEAYRLVLARYDAANKPARAALDGKGKQWRDDCTDAQRTTVEQAWRIVAKKLAPLHRDLGRALVDAGEVERGMGHLEQCLAYDPVDVKAHEALGHESYGDFHGTAVQIAFLKRLAAIEQKGNDLAAESYAAETLPAEQAPEELVRAKLAVVGAKTRGWRVWTTSPAPETAASAAQWAERAQDLLDFLLTNGPLRRRVRIDGRPVAWVGLLRTEAEWDAFFAANPQVLAAQKLTAAPEGASFHFKSSKGDAAVFRHHESIDGDNIIAHVTMLGFAGGANEGLGQGLVHAMTSLLVGTMNTWFGQQPTTRAGRAELLPRDPKAWTERIEEEVRDRKDWPLVQVPRERLESFREAVRVKAWSFVLWLLARHPDAWPKPFEALASDKPRMPEEIAAVFQSELGTSVERLEAEWREWASGDTPIAKAARRGN